MTAKLNQRANGISSLTPAAKIPLMGRPPGLTLTHKVSQGDTLQSMAGKYYGDRNKWPVIFKANQGVIGSNPNLTPGQMLQIP